MYQGGKGEQILKQAWEGILVSSGEEWTVDTTAARLTGVELRMAGKTEPGLSDSTTGSLRTS